MDFATGVLELIVAYLVVRPDWFLVYAAAYDSFFGATAVIMTAVFGRAREYRSTVLLRYAYYATLQLIIYAVTIAMWRYPYEIAPLTAIVVHPGIVDWILSCKRTTRVIDAVTQPIRAGVMYAASALAAWVCNRVCESALRVKPGITRREISHAILSTDRESVSGFIKAAVIAGVLDYTERVGGVYKWAFGFVYRLGYAQDACAHELVTLIMRRQWKSLSTPDSIRAIVTLYHASSDYNGIRRLVVRYECAIARFFALCAISHLGVAVYSMIVFVLYVYAEQRDVVRAVVRVASAGVFQFSPIAGCAVAELGELFYNPVTTWIYKRAAANAWRLYQVNSDLHGIICYPIVAWWIGNTRDEPTLVVLALATLPGARLLALYALGVFSDWSLAHLYALSLVYYAVVNLRAASHHRRRLVYNIINEYTREQVTSEGDNDWCIVGSTSTKK